MDGNGRWAQARGLPRIAGHRAGGEAVRKTVEAAARLKIATLTLYAFSSDNWRRPKPEVRALMRMFGDYLARETSECAKHGIRIAVIGRRDRLPGQVVDRICRAESLTAAGTARYLRLAIDYSSRDAILSAASRLDRSDPHSRDSFASLITRSINDSVETPDVDLLIRTGGEKRLSDFLLWESAYAELLFLDRMWPDFSESDLVAAAGEYRSRERRFGRISPVSRLAV
jgi:undecaprenyl diphosphate synthase